MTQVYETFDKAFYGIEAYTLHKKGKSVGRVALKHSQSGYGSCRAFFQVWGVPMEIGKATGCGYDRSSAAVEVAVAKLNFQSSVGQDPKVEKSLTEIKNALATDDGERWHKRLENAGFTVCHVFG